MLECIRPVILVLLISVLNLASSSSSSSSSSSQNGTQPRFPHISDYYSQYEDITTEPPGSSSTLSEAPEHDQCDYDMCVEQQQTCQELAEVTGCLCPGLSNNFDLPSAPRLLYLTQQDGKSVMVHWCAPTSIVNHYNVLVKDNDKVMERKMQVEEKKRATVLEDVIPGAVVCVEAVNKAGVSRESKESCATFEPQHSDSGLALKLAIFGGVVGLIALLTLALLFWRHKTRQKSTMQPKTEGVL